MLIVQFVGFSGQKINILVMAIQDNFIHLISTWIKNILVRVKV